jgi:hypothetical protein
MDEKGPEVPGGESVPSLALELETELPWQKSGILASEHLTQRHQPSTEHHNMSL